MEGRKGGLVVVGGSIMLCYRLCDSTIRATTNERTNERSIDDDATKLLAGCNQRLFVCLRQSDICDSDPRGRRADVIIPWPALGLSSTPVTSARSVSRSA